MPGDCTLLSLDASHAILMRVLHFKDSGLRHRTPVRPMILTGQTGLELLLTVKIRQPSHEFTFGVGMSFIPYPLVLTPVV
jgi:hypothetical protein